MNPDSVLKEMYRQGKLLSSKAEEFADIGIALAEAERSFRVALSSKMMILKSEGIAISTCESLAKGDPLVSNLRFERDKQAILLDACKKTSESIKMKIDILRSDLSWAKCDIHYVATPGE